MSLTRPDSPNLNNSKHGSEETTTGIKTSSQPNKADESKDTLTPNQPTPKIAWYRKHLWLLILGMGLGSVFMVLTIVTGLILGYVAGWMMANQNYNQPKPTEYYPPYSREVRDLPAPGGRETPPKPTQEVLPSLPTPEDRPYGKNDSRYVLIEYADLDCPFCKQVHPNIQQFIEANSQDISWVFRHFPLTGIHPDAENLAQLAECAGNQEDSAFWEMLEVIYASRPTPAADIPTPKELDAQELQSCLQNLETLPKIRQQAKEAQAIGLNGTPSIYILDTKTGEFGFIDGSTSSQNLQMVFDQLKTPSEDESI